MPFIPHTKADIDAMLATIGVSTIDALFDEIPANIRAKPFTQLPPALNEMALGRLMQQRAAQDTIALNFIGAGAYEHHVPAAVWDIATRGEFMTAYTPYQAEASQGTLQVLYEYQTMLASLTGMDVSNASLYDGASALGEAIFMAVRANKNKQQATMRVLMPTSLHPLYRATAKTMVEAQGIELVEVPVSQEGHIDVNHLDTEKPFTALIMPQPNFFGILEDVDALTDWAHAQRALVIAVVNPLALAILKEPGQWGQHGADIVCGELQPLGIPLSSGGPYAGFLCCRLAHVRQMPGRIVGATIDKEGKRGFTLTLQAREQHIRRAKATSNICTNQGLLVTAVTIYLSLLGFTGLQHVAAQCHANTQSLFTQLQTLPNVKNIFHRPYFHEIVVKIPHAKKALSQLAKQNILGGYLLEDDYPTLKDCVLLCVTETKTAEDLQHFIRQLRLILEKQHVTSTSTFNF